MEVDNVRKAVHRQPLYAIVLQCRTFPDTSSFLYSCQEQSCHAVEGPIAIHNLPQNPTQKIRNLTLHARMFMLYASLKGRHAHKFTGDLARTHAASPNIAKCHAVTTPSVAKCTTSKCAQRSQRHTGKRCIKEFTWVQNFPRETRHGGVEDLSRRVTC